MALVVQKYGGTSVGDVDRIKNVASRVIKTKKQGHEVVVVVSAMAGETDKLVRLAQRISSSPERCSSRAYHSRRAVSWSHSANASASLSARARTMIAR